MTGKSRKNFFLFDHTAKNYVLVMTNSTLVAMAQQAKANRQVYINVSSTNFMDASPMLVLYGKLMRY